MHGGLAGIVVAAVVVSLSLLAVAALALHRRQVCSRNLVPQLKDPMLAGALAWEGWGGLSMPPMEQARSMASGRELERWHTY